MKKNHFILPSVFFCMMMFLSACMSVDYIPAGKTDRPPIPDKDQVEIFYERKQIPVPVSEQQLVGKITASASTSSHTLFDMKKKLKKIARKKGANAILINSIDDTKKGNVRNDQVKNQQASTWTPIADSASDIAHQNALDVLMGTKNDPELPVYKLTIQAEFYKIPPGVLVKNRIIVPEKQPRRNSFPTEKTKINIRSN